MIKMKIVQWNKRKRKVISKGLDMKEKRKEMNKNLLPLDQYLQHQEALPTLKFITCGSVDDGKSTLIGRMLYEAQALLEEQLLNLQNESKKYGTQGQNIDYALLVDGLSAEREQGITIDVAYRFFSTENKRFIVADAPGHEEYTKNMVTGASNADLAIILVDARKGILEQTKRHSFLASLLGIKDIVLAINKMDLIEYSQEKFDQIVGQYKLVLDSLNFNSVSYIPISALNGENIKLNSSNLAWYKGPSLLNFLEIFEIESDEIKSLRMPVQNILRPNQDFRGICGMIQAGHLKKGQHIKIASSNSTSKVKSINIGDKEISKAIKGQSISIELEKDLDVSRGDLIVSQEDKFSISNLFEVNLAWLSEDKCFRGRKYLFKIGTRYIKGKILDIKHKYNVNNFEKLKSNSLRLNDIACAVIQLDEDIPFDTYQENRETGSLILIDPVDYQTKGAATILHSVRRATNIHKQKTNINRENRELLNGHKGKLIWFTGLSGSGKSTIANALEIDLHYKDIKTYLLDGDNLRLGLNQDLGFKEEDRVENIRRVGEVAKLMVDAGLYVLASFISPYEKDRQMVRDLFQDEDYVEVFVSTSLEVSEKRDPKGLYKKAREGRLPNFTGINSPYEKPNNSDIVIDTDEVSVKRSVHIISSYLGL